MEAEELGSSFVASVEELNVPGIWSYVSKVCCQLFGKTALNSTDAVWPYRL